jgi:hypothetical protein
MSAFFQPRARFRRMNLNLLEIFSANPWLVAVTEIAFVALVGVVVGIVCISFNVCRRKIRLAQFDLELKRDMLQRGMSAEEIRTVIEAGRPAVSDHDPRACGDHLRETQDLMHK